MKESLWVINSTRGAISLNLNPGVSDEALIGVSKHKVKRLIKASGLSLRIDSMHKINLVVATGLSVDEIRSCPDFQMLIRKGALVVQWETHVVVVEDAIVEEVKEESILVESDLVNEPVEIELEEIELIEEAVPAEAPVFAPKSKKEFRLFKKNKKE